MELDAFYGLPSAPPNRIVHKNESTKMHVSRARTPNTTTTIHTALSANSFFLVEGLFFSSGLPSLVLFFHCFCPIVCCFRTPFYTFRFFQFSLPPVKKGNLRAKRSPRLVRPPVKKHRKEIKKRRHCNRKEEGIPFLNPPGKRARLSTQNAILAMQSMLGRNHQLLGRRLSIQKERHRAIMRRTHLRPHS